MKRDPKNLLIRGARGLNRVLGLMGFRVTYWPAPVDDERLRGLGKQGGFAHARLEPFASLSPWLTDAAFLEAHALIAHHTLVDLYRCHELWMLVGELRHLEGDILEVGTWRGGSGVLMAQQCRRLRLGASVILCDTFHGVPKAGAGDTDYSGGEHADASAAGVRELGRRAGVDDLHILEGVFPEETSGTIAERRFRLCHIDVDVYRSAKDVLEWVWPRLVPGGVVVFDDYGFKGCEGVARVVEEQRGQADRLTIYNLNGHALVIKR